MAKLGIMAYGSSIQPLKVKGMQRYRTGKFISVQKVKVLLITVYSLYRQEYQ